MRENTPTEAAVSKPSLLFELFSDKSLTKDQSNKRQQLAEVIGNEADKAGGAFYGGNQQGRGTAAADTPR